MSPVGDDVVAVFEVRGEHAVVSGEVSAGARHEGGEAGDKVHRVEHEPGGEEAEAFQCEAAELVEHLGDDERNNERGRLSGEQLAQRTRSEQFEHHGISGSRVARMITVRSATATGMNRKDRQNSPPIWVVGGVAVWSRKCGRCRCKRRRFAVEVRRYGGAGNAGSVSGRGWAGGEAQGGRGAPVGRSQERVSDRRGGISIRRPVRYRYGQLLPRRTFGRFPRER